MAKRPRVFIPGHPHHVVRHGHDHKAVFIHEIERRTGLRIETRDRAGRGRNKPGTVFEMGAFFCYKVSSKIEHKYHYPSESP